MNRLLPFFIILMTSTTLFADWHIEVSDTSSPDTAPLSATIKNEAGFELALFKSEKGTVWMNFTLSDDSLDEFAIKQLPLFQIDDRKPVQLLRGFVATIVPPDEGISTVVVEEGGHDKVKTGKDFSVNHIVAERLPERIMFPIWQGDDKPHFNTIEALAQGHSIRFKYTLVGGSTAETHFTLKGASEAISRLLDK